VNRYQQYETERELSPSAKQIIFFSQDIDELESDREDEQESEGEIIDSS